MKKWTVAVAALASLAFVESAAAQYGGGFRGCVMFEHFDYNGRALRLRPNRAWSTGDAPSWNDRVSSARTSRGCTLVIYEHGSMEGRSTEIRGRVRAFGRGWNDVVSSAECYCRGGGGGGYDDYEDEEEYDPYNN